MKRFTGYRDKHGNPIHDGDKVSVWLSAPWDNEQPIERFVIIRKEGRQWFCDGVESNDENNFLKEFKALEVVIMKMTKEFRAGMEHAIRTIAATNPEAGSINTETRNQCQREIWKEIDRMVVEDAKTAAPAGMKFTGIQKMGGNDVVSYKEL